MRFPRIAITLLSLSALVSFGCKPIDDIDAAVDCNDICSRYRDCFDSNYDIASCHNRCDDAVNWNPGVANECDTCLDGRACAESAECIGDCHPIIP
jgi:hypothetical protein